MGRSWIKLWVNEWLDGTTRYQMTGAQRAFFVDLLALAGRSRCEGIICAGRDGNSYIGYPLEVFEALNAGKEIDIRATFDLLQRTGKIKLEITSKNPKPLFKITILNWSKYQSEYDRQKVYRQRLRGKVTREVTSKVTSETTEKLLVEGEVEREIESDGRKLLPRPPQGSAPSRATSPNVRSGQRISNHPEDAERS